MEIATLSRKSQHRAFACRFFFILISTTWWFLFCFRYWDYAAIHGDKDNPLYVMKPCFENGGTLATFEKGNSQQKMANFFKWLATDAQIQTEYAPIDFQLDNMATYPPFVVGITKDPFSSSYFWETYPPTLVTSSYWMKGQPASSHQWGCVVAVSC